jgi:hypothetical protein
LPLDTWTWAFGSVLAGPKANGQRTERRKGQRRRKGKGRSRDKRKRE